MAAVHRLDVQFPPNFLTCRLIERLMRNTQLGGARWIKRCAICDPEGVLAEHLPASSMVSALTARKWR